MFCTKCGYEYPDGARFCERCGEKLDAASTPLQTPDAEPAIRPPRTICEYYACAGSAAAAKRQTALKILMWISIGIQLVLQVLGLVSCLPFLAVPQLFMVMYLMYVTGVVFSACAFIFTSFGVKKRSPGFLFATLPFAFLSVYSGILFTISIRAVIISILCVIAAIHIIMLIINSKNVKEFKDYLNNRK